MPDAVVLSSGVVTRLWMDLGGEGGGVKTECALTLQGCAFRGLGSSAELETPSRTLAPTKGQGPAPQKNSTPRAHNPAGQPVQGGLGDAAQDPGG